MVGALTGASPSKPTPPPAPAPVGSSSDFVVAAPVSAERIYTADTAHQVAADMPTVHAFDSGTAAAPARSTWVSFSRNADYQPFVPMADLFSPDGGTTFAGQARVPGLGTASRRADGSVLNIMMGTEEAGQNAQLQGATLTTRLLYAQTSTDNGKTLSAPFPVKVDISPERFTSTTSLIYPDNMFLAPDGTLYLPAYAVVENGGTTASLLLQSKDNGANWTLHSVIARGKLNETRQFNETAVAFTSKGDLLAVMRNCAYVRNSETGALSCNYAPLQVSRLSNPADPKATWSAPTEIVAPGFPSMIRPRLHMLPNGILALSAGRPDMWLAISPDGTGNSFEQPTLVYRNQALYKNGDPVPFPGTINEGSSGNSGFDWVQSNRIVASADTCHQLFTNGSFTDKCRWRESLYDMSDTNIAGIVKRPIDILTPGAGKIDLGTKVRTKTASITIDQPYTNASRPRLGANGMVDGSNETWSSAASAGGGTYTLALDKSYPINRIGLSQWIGKEQQATVALASSPEGPWKTVWETGPMTSYALSYRDIEATDAQYVRITTPGSNTCPEGMAAPCSMINEIELYAADMHTFENDPLFGLPRDYVSTPEGVVVVDINTANAGRVLQLSDNSKQTTDVSVTLNTPAAAQRTLSLAFKPHWNGFDQEVALDKFVITLLGSQGNKDVDAFKIGIADDGSVHTWDKKGWSQIAPAGSVPGTLDFNDAWSRLELRATTSQVTLLVNGKQVATAPSQANVKSLTGYRLATDSDPQVDDQIFYLDEISFR